MIWLHALCYLKSREIIPRLADLRRGNGIDRLVGQLTNSMPVARLFKSFDAIQIVQQFLHCVVLEEIVVAMKSWKIGLNIL